MCDLYRDDDGSCEVWRESRPKARKEHRCEDCNRAIPVGERHLAVFSVFEGDAITERLCARCTRAFDWLRARGHYTTPLSEARSDTRHCIDEEMAEARGEAWNALPKDATEEQHRPVYRERLLARMRSMRKEVVAS